MTVKELIIALLDHDLNRNVAVRTPRKDNYERFERKIIDVTTWEADVVLVAVDETEAA